MSAQILHPDFKSVTVPTSEGSRLGMILPRKGVKILVRPGMAVVCEEGFGRVLQVHKDFATVQISTGKLLVMTYPEMMLVGATGPDPDCLTTGIHAA